MKFRLIKILMALMAAGVFSLTAQEQCGEAQLREAQSAFDIGRFQQAINMLRPCIPMDNQRPPRRQFAERRYRFRAHRLVAIAYIAMDSLDNARIHVRQMIDLRPAYVADPDNGDPLLLGQMLAEERPRRPWKMISGLSGAAVLLGAAIIYQVSRGDEEPGPARLPGPPIFPDP